HEAVGPHSLLLVLLGVVVRLVLVPLTVLVGRAAQEEARLEHPDRAVRVLAPVRHLVQSDGGSLGALREGQLGEARLLRQLHPGPRASPADLLIAVAVGVLVLLPPARRGTGERQVALLVDQ